MSRPKKEVVDNSTMLNIKERLAYLEMRIDTLSSEHTLPSTHSVPETKTVTIETSEFSPYPVPDDYRKVVDIALNQHFGIEVEPHTDAPLFDFKIIVPDRYSSISEGYKQMYKRDVRVKVIDYATGVNGVKLYAESVFKSFNPEVQALIAIDRIH